MNNVFHFTPGRKSKSNVEPWQPGTAIAQDYAGNRTPPVALMYRIVLEPGYAYMELHDPLTIELTPLRGNAESCWVIIRNDAGQEVVRFQIGDTVQ